MDTHLLIFLTPKQSHKEPLGEPRDSYCGQVAETKSVESTLDAVGFRILHQSIKHSLNHQSAARNGALFDLVNMVVRMRLRAYHNEDKSKALGVAAYSKIRGFAELDHVKK
jgi:hypothetical protein